MRGVWFYALMTHVYFVSLCAEAEIARTQKNKATEGHLMGLKARLAKLRTQVQRRQLNWVISSVRGGNTLFWC